MNKLLGQLLKKRGFSEDFLTPKYEDLIDARELPDMEKAVERIKKAVREKEKVLIYGDYDADGVTAAAIMRDTLVKAGIQEVVTVLPDRFKDGYGLNMRVVEQAEREKAALVVTVDCGSNNAEVVMALGVAGIDVIVTDHHEIMGELPQAVAVINPQRLELGTQKNAELKMLCGAGVAFMVARGLVQAGLIPAGQEKWLLDLVVIGTICDNMTLVGQNRILGFYGLKVLKKTRRVGLVELMRVAGVKKLSAEAIGFQIGPRLNAAGRLASAELAYRLLTADSRANAAQLAQELEDLNRERKQQQQRGVQEIEQRGVGEKPVIVAVGDWHEGVLGIIAGRLVEEYRRPVFVLAPTAEDEQVLKGSARSFGEFSLAEVCRECKNSLVAGGGHAGACGVKVLKEKLTEFEREVNKFYQKLELKNQERFLEQTEDLVLTGVEQLNQDLAQELKKLEPCGIGNVEPIFKLERMRIVEARKMGEEEKHLRLIVQGEDGGTLKLLAFSAPKLWLDVTMGDEVTVWINLIENEWRGLRSVEGRILRLEYCDECENLI